MTTLIACDLDRTMIFSQSAAERPVDGLVCVEHYQDAALSYMTQEAVELLRAVTEQAVYVPTTTRTIEQYRRIVLPGGPHRYAITSNGGNILVDSQPDEAWHTTVVRRIRECGASLEDVTAELRRWIDDSWVLNFRTADDLFCYLVVDLASVPTHFVAEWSSWAFERNWAVSVQGRKIYTVPAVLCKSAAVVELRRRLDGISGIDGFDILAAGDGALDAELLRYADRAIRPRHGELESVGFLVPGLDVTTSSGAAAGEEILRWMLEAVASEANSGRQLLVAEESHASTEQR